MKNLIIHPFILLLLLVTSQGCEENKESIETHSFEANFYTVLKGFVEDSSCAAPKNFLNTQEGEGSATLIGPFTTSMTFCVDPTTLEYDNVKGSFVGNNGDSIEFNGFGQVLPSEKEGYDLEFHDTFTITGGTGRFAGASGELVSDSFVKQETQRTDHVWSGTIMLVN
jgi:hypothetical protein